MWNSTTTGTLPATIETGWDVASPGDVNLDRARLTLRDERADRFLGTEPKRLLIDGAWVDAVAGETFETIDPATGEVLAAVARGRAADVDAAVGAAKAATASPGWREMRPADRSALLWRIADLIEANADQLAQLESLDQGKNWRTSRFGEIPAAVSQFRYYAGWPTKILGETIPTSLARTPPGKRVFAYTRREPVGVVAAIVPWNSPLLMAAGFDFLFFADAYGVTRRSAVRFPRRSWRTASSSRRSTRC